jgi:hypothetical protein
MRCEKCLLEIEKTTTCARCGTSVLELGPFCYLCGHDLRRSASETEDMAHRAAGNVADEIDFSTRLLCSDGACIGVINEHGVCKICGKPYVPDT